VFGEKHAKKPTVPVMSDEHTSQTYFTPPSVPLIAVFFLMRPMVQDYGRKTKINDA
jgi:hypothetical protein